MKEKKNILALFDVDGTLTEPRKQISTEMNTFINNLKEVVSVGVVGGSNLEKQKEQLGQHVIHHYKYSFSENGLIAYENGKLIGTTMINQHLGENTIKEIVNWILDYLSKLVLPIKRGTFIEYRSGMLNISPIGRNCSQQERDEFEKFDKKNKIRQIMIDAMRKKFHYLNLTYSIGGQISFDVFPEGWDKTFCLSYIPESKFDEIHFFGDKTFEGGNDYEIFNSSRVIGHCVSSPKDTMKKCKQIFM